VIGIVPGHFIGARGLVKMILPVVYVQLFRTPADHAAMAIALQDLRALLSPARVEKQAAISAMRLGRRFRHFHCIRHTPC